MFIVRQHDQGASKTTVAPKICKTTFYTAKINCHQATKVK